MLQWCTNERGRIQFVLLGTEAQRAVHVPVRLWRATGLSISDPHGKMHSRCSRVCVV